MIDLHIRKQGWLLWFGFGLAACGQAPGDESSSASQEIVNGGFETGALAPDWILATNTNNGLAAVPPANTGQLALAAGGTNRTSIKTNTLGVQTPLTNLTAGAGVPTWPRTGNSSVVINETGSNNNVNSLTQSWVTDATDVDPFDGKVHVRFLLAPVLQNPGHVNSQQPYFFVALRNKTAPRAAEFFTEFNFANQPGVPWQSQSSGAIQFTDWQLFDIAPDATQFVLGDTLEVQVYAAGCSLGGHWGEVFLDGVGSQLPGLAVQKTGPTAANVNTDITYSFQVVNNNSGLVQNVIVDDVLPAGTTFVSVNAPSATCTTPAVGANGTVTCNFGAMNPGSSHTFDLVVHLGPTIVAGAVVTNGNYGVKGDTVSRTLGPKRSTTITAAATYADLMITKSDGVAAVGTGSATTYTIVASNLGPSAATGATVTDTVPAGLTGATWTCVGAGGGTCPASGSGNINAAVNLPAGASATFTLTGTATAAGKLINTALIAAPGGVTDNVPGNNAQTDVNDVGTLRSFTVNKDPAGNGTGTVVTAPAAISCNGACATQSTSFLDGTSVTLTATADPGSVFVGWSGDCSGAALTCTVTVTQAMTVVAKFTTCGGGTLQAGEGCDDGNSVNGDGCDSSCKIENGNTCNANAAGAVGDPGCASGICDVSGGAPGTCEAAGCGNGRLEAGEGCDDGNTAAGDGCDTTCKVENGNTCNANAAGAVGDPGCASGICDASGGAPGTCEAAGCGNGRIEAGEGCDDGNTLVGDGCDTSCKIENGRPCNANVAGLTGDASCVSGICDVSGGAPGTCEMVGCGDGRLEAGEGCDDGNTFVGDGCDAVCKIENGSACNTNVAGATGDASCASGVCDVSGGAPGTCEMVGCGDSRLGVGEGCDDGNTASSDGCDSSCKIEDSYACNTDVAGSIGDASCASGVCDVTGGGPGTCETVGCGDSRLGVGEGCDDGNTANGDGCDSSCKIESGNACNANVAGAIGDASCASGVCDVSGGAPGMCEIGGCGDGRLGAGEGCDDGNTANGDACSATCKIENNGMCNADAAGAVGDAGCESGICDQSGGAPGICEPEGCGDGRIEAGEGCDDGNTTAGGGCDAACKVENGSPCNASAPGLIADASCVSGICDQTNGAPGTCRSLGCGNNRLEADEGCDDGNHADGDACNAGCKIENGNPCNTASPGITGNSSCVSGICDTSGGTAGTCEMMGCGDGRLAAGEGCDDGNTSAGDGCNAMCKIEDGKSCNITSPGATGGASCESGMCDTTSGGAGVCFGQVCGDNKVQKGEECDDGNAEAGDGCNSLCKVEAGWNCDESKTPECSRYVVSGGSCSSTDGAGAGLLLVVVALMLRRRRYTCVALAGAAVSLLAPKAAHAQLVERLDFPVERFHLSSDRGGMFGVEGPLAGNQGSLDIGIWGGFADDPLVVYRETPTGNVRTGALVHSRVGSELVGRYAITNWLALGVEVPFVVYQARESMVEGITGMLGAVGAGIGDLRLSPKLVLSRNPKLAVAIVPELTFPTGQTDEYHGERTVAFAPTLVVGTTQGAVRVVANLGYLARRQSQSTAVRVDDELVARLGVAAAATDSVEIAATGSLSTAAESPFSKAAVTHLEFIGGPVINLPSRWQIFGGAGIGVSEGYGTPDWRALAGLRFGALAGMESEAKAKPIMDSDHDGILDADDKCPTEAEDQDSFEDSDGCPDPDNDKDGILDPSDKCPLDPENMNNFEDIDGCPDAAADSDGDGILDNLDKCPQQAEDKDNFEDDDGCPDPDNDKDGVLDGQDNCPNEPGSLANHGCKDKKLVVIQGGKIDLLDVVYFELDKDIILAKSYPLLDDVATVINQHPGITKIEVQGHTDSQGNDDYNMDLSQRRASQVRAYLVDKGVPADRLEAKGYGETQPIADNKSTKGRAANRRVVFKLIGDLNGVQQQQSGPSVDTMEKERK